MMVLAKTWESKGPGEPLHDGAFPSQGSRRLGFSTTSNGGYLVNAAFLLVTTALLAGQTPPPPAAGGPAAPISTPIQSTAPSGGCSGGDCGAASSCGCCDTGCGRQGLFSRLKGVFNRGSSCGCDTCSSCSTPAYHHAASWSGSCGCTDACESSRGGLFARLRSRFSRGNECGCASDCGCGSGCSGCGGGASGVVAPVAPGGKVESLTTPPKEDAPGKKMPTGGEEKKVGGIEPPTGQIRTQIPAAPALEAAPAIIPNVPANNQEQRDPPF
jgi:hypothetical protein